MNLIKTQTLIAAAGCLLLLHACKKDDAPTPNNTLSYKVDGVSKIMKPEANYFWDNSLLITSDKITAVEQVILFIDSNITTGTFELPRDNNYVSLEYDMPGTDLKDYFFSRSGKMVISSYDGNHVSGTFEFTASNGITTKSITEGTFTADVGYFPEPQSCGDSSLYAVRRHMKLLKLH